MATSAQRSAAVANLAKARAAAAHKPKTAKQIAAAKAGLAKARAAEKGKPRTAKQIAAARAVLAKARAVEAHKPRTAKQLAAARANLAKARAVEAHKPRSAKQLAVALANLAKGRHTVTAKRRAAAIANLAKARAVEKGKPRTAKQIAAAKAALAKARAARHLRAALKAKSASVSRRVAHGKSALSAVAWHKRAMNLRRGKYPAIHHPRVKRAHRNAKALVSSHIRRSLRGYLHTRQRHHRSRIIVRRRVYAHRVWKRRRR